MLTSSDFNQLVELENGKPVIDMEEAYIMYVALDPCSGELDPLPCVRRNDFRFRGYKGGACQEAGFARC